MKNKNRKFGNKCRFSHEAAIKDNEFAMQLNAQKQDQPGEQNKCFYIYVKSGRSSVDDKCRFNHPAKDVTKDTRTEFAGYAEQTCSKTNDTEFAYQENAMPTTEVYQTLTLGVTVFWLIISGRPFYMKPMRSHFFILTHFLT
jgi:hypothetical protein